MMPAILDIPRILEASRSVAGTGLDMSTRHDLRQQGRGFTEAVTAYLDGCCDGSTEEAYVVGGTAVRCLLSRNGTAGWRLRLVDAADRNVGNLVLRPSGMLEYGCAEAGEPTATAEGIAAAEALFRSAAAGSRPLG